jgi:hypothetical protein
LLHGIDQELIYLLSDHVIVTRFLAVCDVDIHVMSVRRSVGGITSPEYTGLSVTYMLLHFSHALQ